MPAIQIPGTNIKYGWQEREAGWGPGMNTNLLVVGQVARGYVLSRSVVAPPSDPSEGDAYLVPVGASGAWAGQDDRIAAFHSNAWLFIYPLGSPFLVKDEGEHIYWNGSGYEAFAVSGADADRAEAAAEAAETAKLAAQDAKEAAESAQGEAQTAETNAAASQSAAAASASSAATSASDAQTYAEAAATAGDIYDDTTDGLAGTTEGDYFWVPSAVDGELLILYRHDSGPVATEIGTSPAAGIIEDLFNLEDQTNERVALFQDDDGNVPLWLTNGLLDASGVSPALLQYIFDNKPEDSTPVVATDGRSLFRAKQKVASLNNGDSAQLKILFVGDSWSQRRKIPQLFADQFYAELGEASTGWVGVGSDASAFMVPLNDATYATSGFTLVDAGSAPMGIDLQRIEATGTSATVSIGDLVAESLTIYSYDGDGTFRYRVDGGAWTDVVGAGGGGTTATEITGLTDAAHDIDIDLTGNTGTVQLLGFYAQRTADGVEISKAGNGGTTADDWSTYATESAAYLSDIDPDVVFVSLGTNDAAGKETAENYKAQMATILDAYTAAVPDASIVVMAAPNNGDDTTDLTPEYAVALNDLVQGYAMVELLNVEAMTSDYTTMSGLGFWADARHLTDAGAQFLYNQFRKYVI